MAAYINQNSNIHIWPNISVLGDLPDVLLLFDSVSELLPDAWKIFCYSFVFEGVETFISKQQDIWLINEIKYKITVFQLV